MPEPAHENVTRMLGEVARGREGADEELLKLVYEELRDMARLHLQRERPGHTLQPTALVHEAYLRLVGQAEVTWQNRAHFLGVASIAIRRILVDHARRRQAAKRGGDLERVTLSEAEAAPGSSGLDLLALNESLEQLASLDPRKSRVVELRFFGGLDIKQTAEVLDVSPATVERDWSLARAWLYRQLNPDQENGQ